LTATRPVFNNNRSAVASGVLFDNLPFDLLRDIVPLREGFERRLEIGIGTGAPRVQFQPESAEPFER
jgi:hypothetical protein